MSLDALPSSLGERIGVLHRSLLLVAELYADLFTLFPDRLSISLTSGRVNNSSLITFLIIIIDPLLSAFFCGFRC